MKKLFYLFFCLGYVFNSYSQNENGYTKFYYPNGKISSEGILINGKPDGYWRTYYVTGILKSEGNRKSFKLDSLWTFYNETGDTLEKINYLLGKRNGYTFLYKTINEKNNIKQNYIAVKELYVNDSKEGPSYEYFPDGTIKLQLNYSKNKKHGKALEYKYDGVPITIYEYFNDYLVEKININRTIENKPEGIWRTYYPTGKLKKEENFKEGQLSGYSKEYDEKGNVINSMLFRDGLVVDKDKTDTIDLNEILTKYPNGSIKTRAYYKDSLLIGIYREYDTTGNVILSKVYDEKGVLLSTGVIQDNGSREGLWTYYFPNGHIKSAGEFKNNRQNGEWKFFFDNGSNEQIGNFLNGTLTGTWYWFYQNNTLLKVENFNRSKLEGLYYELSNRGDTLVKGNYTEGLKNGIWINRVGDVTEIGNYVNDLKEGIWKSFYLNGQLLYQGNYINGLPEGKHIIYYENGYIKEEQYYINGFKEKIWKKFDNEGNLLLTITYNSDREIRINGIKIDDVKRK